MGTPPCTPAAGRWREGGAQIRASRRAPAPTRRAAVCAARRRVQARGFTINPLIQQFWSWNHVQNTRVCSYCFFLQFVASGSKRPGNSGLRTAIRTPPDAHPGHANYTTSCLATKLPSNKVA
eukprot:gene21776-biopygen11696